MSAVWVKTPEAASKEVAFLPATVISVDGESVEVKLEQSGGGLTKGEVRRMASSETRLRFQRGDGATASDNTALVHMNDASILDNLFERHKQDLIYTYTASVLLAVNPYKSIAGIYGDDQCRLYRGKHLGALPPHPYAIADTAYRTLVREKVNQAMLISGESGAGKTETAKIVMQYLAFASGSSSDVAAKIQARVLQAQPILESFGNAATLRNSNSSRFGKYNRLYFDAKGTLVNAGIQTYLLESSRVVVHGQRERTYHVFYEMLQGLPEDQLKAFHLEKGKQYRLLHNDGESAASLEDTDGRNFERLRTALETVGKDSKSIDAYFQVLAGLVHLGNIPKDDAEVEMAARAAQENDNESDTRTVEVNEDSVAYAAELLGMDPDELCSVLKRKRIAIPGRDSMHEVPRSPLHFRQALHSLIKALYKRLFEHTVRHINDSFNELKPEQAADGEDWKNIGILDIYGFERLQRNSFEQLCINLANERLQQYFVENVLCAEQQLYTHEGLPWTGLKLPDAEPVVNCISYVFKTLDDFSSRNAKGFGEAQQVSDDHFCERVLKECSAHSERKDILKAPKISAKEARAATGPRVNEVFIITHYAGNVDYSTKGWLDKNNDRLLPECEALVVDSKQELVKSLAEEDSKPFRSISSKYSKDLETLLKTLGEANLHYIRCFKPNALQKPNLWNGELVLDQIVQCGTIELVKIMQDGFPNRCTFQELFDRFKALLPEKFQRYGMRTFVEALMLAYEVPRTDWALGTSRLFLKAGQLKALEDMRADGAAPKTENLERIVKQIIRKRWARACTAIRLCIWMPKMLRKVYADQAATKLSAVAHVTSRIAPRVEAAKKRVQEKRQKARRRLAGIFRCVLCLNKAYRQIKDQRRERAVTALYRHCFIIAHTKPWIHRAREYLRDAEVRRKQEEERLRQEMERKLKEEEELLRKDAEQRRQEEDERHRLETEKRRLEEEERMRVDAERRRLEDEAAANKKEEEEAKRLAGLEAKAEEERLELDRLREEERKRLEAAQEMMRQKMEEEFHQKMAEEKRCMEEEMKKQMAEQLAVQAAELEAQKLQATQDMETHRLEQERHLEDQRREIDRKHKEVEDTVRKARLSISMVGSVRTLDDDCQSATEIVSTAFTGEDSETDIGDSVSCINGSRHELQEATKDVVRNTVKSEVERLVAAHLAEQKNLADQMKLLQEKNAALERRVQKDTLEENGSEADVNALGLSPPANCTPEHGPQSSPLSSIAASPMSHGSKALGSSRKYSLIAKDSAGKLRDKRKSVAHEALAITSMQESQSCATPALSAPVDGSRNAAAMRKWWGQQRSFLMDELYPGQTSSSVKGTTPNRNNSKRTMPTLSETSRQLASEF